MQIRDRVKDFRRCKAGELLPHPGNWRTHPTQQVDALKGVLAEVGIAGALIAYETPHGLQLIDGHCRADVSPETEWPVIVLDVSEAEANKLLATLDPLAAMAEADAGKLDELLRTFETGSQPLADMLTELAKDAGVIPGEKGENDPNAEWEGMPECDNEDQGAWKSVKVNFASEANMKSFAELIGQPLTENTRSVWHPKAEVGRYADKQYANES